jgi:hypothetical protein
MGRTVDQPIGSKPLNVIGGPDTKAAKAAVQPSPATETTPEPGSTLTFSINPNPSAALLAKGVVPAWSSSTDQAVITPAADGLSASVLLADTIVNGTLVSISVRATLPTGKLITGGYRFTVGVPPGPELISFDVVRES